MHSTSSHTQLSRIDSPWPLRNRARYALWVVIRALAFRPSPKFLHRFRNVLLRMFGATIGRGVFVSQSAVIRMPWHLTLHDNACIGERAEIYNLGHVTIGSGATIAQHAYLCAGSHDFDDPCVPLVTAPIDIGDEVFLGAFAIVLLGISIGPRTVVGAGAVVAKDLPSDVVAVGNPVRIVRKR
jgi:putative colanic acid biosynthesis acetyltransferase WcaF